MTLKGSADHGTVYETVRRFMAQGKTLQEAIAKVESIVRQKLPEHIKAFIRAECGYAIH